MEPKGVRGFFARMSSGFQMGDVTRNDGTEDVGGSLNEDEYHLHDLLDNTTSLPNIVDKSSTCFNARFPGGHGNLNSATSSISMDGTDGSILTTIKRIFRSDNNRTVTLAQIGFSEAGGGISRINESLHYCNRSWDQLICWPEILEGHSVTVPCFSSFNQIAYDTSKTVTRACEDGGIWEEKTNYSNCIPMAASPGTNDEWILEITTWVYFIGYCLSITALILAVSIFIALKELRCLRNTIHTHLMLTYISADALWLITSQSHVVSNSHASCVTFILLHYFHLTNFFWMFVEGLYLYVLVVKTFTAENIKLRTYVFLGWGVPLIVVVGWSILKFFTQANPTEAQILKDPELTPQTCLWLTVNLYDWIYKSPAVFVLAANMLFLIRIMWVLITKLRSATNPETQQSRKAAKALVVLMPLLGITYVLILTGSKQTPLYEHLRALLISTQGFLVALLYCCLNGEVRQAIRHRWNRCGGSELVCCKYLERRAGEAQNVRDWSLPRSRTESIRLYSCPLNNTSSLCQNSQHNHFNRARMESTTSEATTLTNLTNSNSIQFGGNLRGAMAGSRPSSILSGDSRGGGRNGFDQILLSPTITSISAALSTPEDPAEQENHNGGRIMSDQAAAAVGLIQAANQGNVGDLSDVDFIDSYEGQVYGA